MTLLFADVVDRYNTERKSNISDDKPSDNELSNKVAEFLDNIDDDCEMPTDTDTETADIKRVFVASLANEYYHKAIDDIANTAVGNKAVRKKNFRQVMQESFFYGSNRFGNNFIA